MKNLLFGRLIGISALLLSAYVFAEENSSEDQETQQEESREEESSSGMSDEEFAEFVDNYTDYMGGYNGMTN